MPMGAHVSAAASVSASVSSLSAATAVASSSSPSLSHLFIPPPSIRGPRSWMVSDLSPRGIHINVAGRSRDLTIEWPDGIAQPFRIREEERRAEDDDEEEEDEEEKHDGGRRNQDDDAVSALHSRLLCNQCLHLLLDSALTNSIANRRLLESMHAMGGLEDVAESDKSPALLPFLVMAVGHMQLVKETRDMLRHMQQMSQRPPSSSPHQQTTAAAPLSHSSIPPFRVKRLRTTQPYLYAFTVWSGKRFIAEATIRGLQFELVTALPDSSSSGSALINAAFYRPVNGHADSNKPHTAPPAAVTININSVHHFAEILRHALTSDQR